jgi:thiazole/oxazole-forming peptide maturase SagD family component
MDILANPTSDGLRPSTQRLLRRMLSPLCGLSQLIGCSVRGGDDPRFVVAGAELTGVHLLNRSPKPKPGFYHIGGGGVFLEEAMIRSLGETVERYSQAISEVSAGREIIFASYDELVQRGERCVSSDKLRFFSDAQYLRPNFPFQAFSSSAPLGWLKVHQAYEVGELYVPAQLLLTGYTPKRNQGESWLLSAVTTGTAAHTSRHLAMRGALLEPIQIDAVIGHWYTKTVAPHIELDARTQPLSRLIDAQFGRKSARPRFHWLPSADLPGMSVACVLSDESGALPAVCVGLGSDLRLNDAMYKALLEAVGVYQLAKITLMNEDLNQAREASSEGTNTQNMFDLDSNVAHYARPANAKHVLNRFGERHSVRARDLPVDSDLAAGEEVALMMRAFRETGKQLVACDLTTSDVRALGFEAVRFWSPDTLSLCFPSTPPEQHKRFQAYGGFSNPQPHPYP